jgi:hypothetical protein
MEKLHVITLWNATIFHSNSIDHDGNESGNYTAFGGAALAKGLKYLHLSKVDRDIADHKRAAAFLREMADALEQD